VFKCSLKSTSANYKGSTRTQTHQNNTHTQKRNTKQTKQKLTEDKGKGKVHPRTRHDGTEGEQMYSSTVPSTSALDGDGWSAPRPGRFTPGKTRYPLYRRLGGPQGRSGRVRKISPPPGFDPWTVQPVASRYTDYAIPATHHIINNYR
jgi:hypothetical protein